MNKPTQSLMLGTKTLGLSLAVSLLTACATQSGLSDGQINANHAGYEVQQGAIKSLNDSANHRVASYSLAKAQCWLDVSYHEYTRNDRSAFVPEALIESQRITDYLAAGGAPDGLDNPAHTTLLVNDAAVLRQDLWDTAANLKQQAGFSCAAQKVACAEVELVHAGNEFNQQGWRHAKPYVQIAEDLMGDASRAADNCTTDTSASAALAKSASMGNIPTLVNVLFNFDKYTMDEARPESIEHLDRLVAKLNRGEHKLTGLKLIGHADASNHTGDPNYNVLLSQRRAKSVLNYLQSHGVDVSNTPIDHRGDSDQVTTCESKRLSRADFIDCMLPNRRVEVSLEMRK